MLKKLSVFLCVFLLACSSVSSSNLEVDNKIGKNSLPFPVIDNDFSRYQHDVHLYLQANSLANRTAADIKLNLPFDLLANPNVNYQGRFLLFHGLNDSPYVWLDFAKEMVSKGFDVRAVLLKGHGSHPKNMLKVSAKDWLKSTRAHYRVWAAEKEAPLFLGGFSMGAVLATTLALEQSEIKGLFLVSPAYHSKLNNLLSFSWIYSKFKPWLFGQMLIEDNPSKYNSIAINSASAYYKLTQLLKRKWSARTLDIPVLMVHTLNDSVVDVDFSRNVFKNKFTNEYKKLVLYTPDVAERKKMANVEFRNSYFPEKRILNQSHLSMMNSAKNFLLGKDRKVLICNGNEYRIFVECLRAKKHWYGAQHTISPDGISVARSTYNPDFDSLVQRFSSIFIPHKLKE